MSKKKTCNYNSIALGSGILCLILLWYLMSVKVGSDIALPTPLNTLKALIKMLSTSSFWLSLGCTLLRLIISLLSSLLLSFLLATLSYKILFLKKFFEPFMAFFRSLPPIMILVAIMMLFNLKITPFFLVLFELVPLLYEIILNSYESIDPVILDDLKTLTSSNIYAYTKVILPLSLNGILSGILSALGLGFKVIVMGEYLATPRPSIGYQILLSSQALDMDKVFSWAIILSVIVIISDIIIRKIQKSLNN